MILKGYKQMTLFLNLVLAVVLVLSIVLFTTTRKVNAEATAAVGSGNELTVAEQQVLGGHRMWANLSVVLIALVVAGFVLINL
jgi:cytochrome c oxidase assembly factor CtaG